MASPTRAIFSRLTGFSRNACENQTPPICVFVKSSTGAPATMPSKSSGKRWADINPWRPPVEQPSQ